MHEYHYLQKTYGLLKAGSYQRTLHYHNTIRENEDLYRRQLDFVKDCYQVPGISELSLGVRSQGKPSLVIGLFDGYRNNYDVFFHLLKEHGLKGWFLLVTDFLDTPVKDQEASLERYRMQYQLGEYGDGRYAMSWAEAAEIAGCGHTIVNHSATHFYLTKDSRQEEIDYEIDHSHELLLKYLGKTPCVFSWLGGAGFSENPYAAKKLHEKGYEYLMGYTLEMEEPLESGDNPAFLQTLQENQGSAELFHMPEENKSRQLEEDICFHKRIMDAGSIFTPVPAILPGYGLQEEGQKEPYEEDLRLAEDFLSLACYLMQEKQEDEWHAVHRALDILAVKGFFGFPFS